MSEKKVNVIAMALGKPKKPSEDEDKADEEEESDDVASDELEAAKAVRSAKSDEDYAAALKTFVKLCGGY